MTRTNPLVLALAAALLMPLAALAATDQAAPQVQGASQAQHKGAGVEQGTAPSSARKARVKARKSARTGRAARRVPRGYGFLPGYEPPPGGDRFGGPADGPSEAYQYGRGGRYWYRGRWYYGWGGPGFYRGRWNGGGFGPCWTETPIGPMWNCGR